MQKAKTCVSQRISTTHMLLYWRPSTKKTHGHNVAPKHARSRTVGGCSARIRLTGLVSALQRWRCCRPLARWAPGQRHFLEVTVLGGSLVVGDIRRHLADPRQCRVEYGLIFQPENLRSADNGLGITRPDLQKNPHNLPPRNCQATNQASASTDAVQLLLQSGRVVLSLRCTASPMLEIEKQHGRPGTPAQRRGMSVLSPGAVALPFTLCT